MLCVALNRRSRDRFIERDRLRDPRRRYDPLDRFERLRLGDLDGIFPHCRIFFLPTTLVKFTYTTYVFEVRRTSSM